MEEAAMWTGATKDNQHVMVCPALLKYVSNEAERQVLLLKSVRKAREERGGAMRDVRNLFWGNREDRMLCSQQA